MFTPDVWLPVLRDVVASAAPLAFVFVLVRVAFNFIVRAASGEKVFH